MAIQQFSATRCKTTRKPRVTCPNIEFFQCDICKNIYQKIGFNQGEQNIVCCENPVKVLKAINAKSILNFNVDYKIVGGHNDNAVEVFWDLEDGENNVEWIYLKTYTGGYIKYITERTKKSIRFALADDDAFAYCDESPCLECVFWCKRGFAIYIYHKKLGLIELLIDKATPYWQSK